MTVRTPLVISSSNQTQQFDGSADTFSLGGAAITSGVWSGTVIAGTYGGTGINNGSSTITLANNLVTSGNFSLTFTTTGTTNVTLPTTGTLLTAAGAVTGATGTANQITVSASVGAVTWSLPTDIIAPGRVRLVKGADIASTGSMTWGTDGNFFHITGTTTITSFNSLASGAEMVAEFDGALLLTYNATSLILPTSASVTTAAGDIASFVSEGSGNWRCTYYTRRDGTALLGSGSTNSFATIAVSGQSDVVADSSSDTLTLVAGTGMTITTTAGSDTITLASSGGADYGLAIAMSNHYYYP